MPISRSCLACLCILSAAALFISACGSRGEETAQVIQEGDSTVTVVDGLGREVSVPFDPDFVICSGPGCLRLLAYLKAQDRIVAVDDMEGRRPDFEARPYALANPWFEEMPIFGEFRGHDNPELIVYLDPQPQVIFKTYPLMGMDPVELESKTGIPVVVLNYGTLTSGRSDLYNSLRTMGAVMDRSERAEEVIAFMDSVMADLRSRTASIPEDDRPSCYVGGIAYRGPHGFQSTEPAYPPFVFVGANNVALPEGMEDRPREHADVAKEQIVAWDPEVLFVDLSTLEADPQSSAIYQLGTDPAYRTLSAVGEGRVYGLMPYNWYTKNFGSILANAYFIGKVLYPDAFADIDPRETADDIYAFLVGARVFDRLNASFQGRVFQRLEI